MPEKVRILIVEDEFITLNALNSALTRMGYEVSGDAMTAEEALMILEREKTDLAILDINLKRGPSGIWLAQKIRERFNIPFIFLTAFGDKGTINEAAETKPASYLVKPFAAQDLHAAIELAMHNYADTEEEASNGETRSLLISDSIFVKDELVYRRIPLREIAFVHVCRNYLEVVSGDNKYILRSALKEFVQQLPADHFFQTHRSYVVNLALVDKIGGNFIGIDRHEVPLSRNVRQEVRNRLNMFS